MTTTEALRRQDNYALGRTPEEYDRLRAQARVWESGSSCRPAWRNMPLTG
jgi:hypothetical protein